MTDDTNIQGIPQPEGDVDLIQTDYDIGQDNIEGAVGPFGFDIHNPVFLISSLSIVAFVVYALLAPTQAGEFFGWLRPALTSSFDWFFLLSANVFVLFCLALIVLPVGKVRLGGADATPDYGYPGWFAMLFAAGMGIGLMFFGVLEPAYYFGTPWGDAPLGTVRPFSEEGALVAANVEEARRMALAATSYHWALHPWAFFAVVALGLALFTYNKGLPLSFR
jgi:BCCT family betaine/carnitine transporter